MNNDTARGIGNEFLLACDLRFHCASVELPKLAETDALWAKAQRGFEAVLGRAESEALHKVLRSLISDDFATAFGNVL